MDVMPTLAELGKEPYPTSYQGHDVLPVQGKSMLPILLGGSRAGHDQICWHYNDNRAIRQGDWKLVWDKLQTGWALFDLRTDRTEIRDLAALHPDRVQQMGAAWETWANETGVKY
jgi:arylsulfatase